MLLYSFRLEAIGDDAWRKRQDARRRGVQYRPSRVRDVVPHRPWVAAITGRCPQYGFVREFMTPTADYRDADKYGTHGVWLYYMLPTGLYEVKELISHYKERRYFARVHDLEMTEITREEVIEWLEKQS